jgi:hypothetical protein
VNRRSGRCSAGAPRALSRLTGLALVGALLAAPAFAVAFEFVAAAFRPPSFRTTLTAPQLPHPAPSLQNTHAPPYRRSTPDET